MSRGHYGEVSKEVFDVKVHVIEVPYDSGKKGARMGRGPEHLARNGLVERLGDRGHELRSEVVELEDDFPAEIEIAFELDRLVAEQVRDALKLGEFPLVLAGDCNVASVGTVAGLGSEGLGVLWFDGHTDFDTPETTRHGSLDGMALAIVTGRCWRRMSGSVPGFNPVAEGIVVHVGSRGLPEELERLESSGVSVVGATLVRNVGMPEAVASALEALWKRIHRVYVHLDLDVLDPDMVAPANGFTNPGGPSVEEAEEAVRMVRKRFDVAGIGVASYDPAYDRDDKVLRACLRFVEILVG